MTDVIAYESRAAFAQRCGVAKSTVTRWAARERVVCDEVGDVDIDASIARLEATRGIRFDVAERWRRERAAKGRPLGPDQARISGDKPAATTGTQRNANDNSHNNGSSGAGPTGDADLLDTDNIGRRTRYAQMLKAEAAAAREQRELEELSGQQVRRADVQRDLTDAAGVILGAWETLPDRVAPLLVDITDQSRIRAILRDEVETLARQIAEQLEQIGDPKAAKEQE